MMRSVSTAVCTAARTAFGILAANPGAAIADEHPMSAAMPGMTMSKMATLNGVISGGHVFSTVANISAINGDGKSTAAITIGTEQ